MQLRQVNVPLAGLARRYASTNTVWPIRPFAPRDPPPACEPSHTHGESKFAFPESLRKKRDFVMPPILDMSLMAKHRRDRELWYTKIRKLCTVEEKILELNMPRYYGWDPITIEEGVLPYDSLPNTQYVTMTHIMPEPGLPSHYDELMSTDELNGIVQLIKSQVEEALIFEYTGKNQNYQWTEEELENPTFMKNLKAKGMSQQINRIMINNLSVKYPHLIEIQSDIEPRLEAFWFFGGFELPKYLKNMRKNMPEYMKNSSANQSMRYVGKPLLHLRHRLPLKNIIELSESTQFKANIPYEPMDPRAYGYFKNESRAIITPGFWPGDQNEFGLVSYNSTAHLAERLESFNDNFDAVKSQAIFGSYSWLYTQACYQGFSTFQDPTYPLVNQMILTNGQWWTFSVYQLNTTSMHFDAIKENEKANICWITKPMKLFDTIENGEVKGLNEEVLQNLVKFYLNVPEVRQGINMKPYLEKEKLVANIEDSERREWVEKTFKHLMSNRARHRLKPEFYHWQWIYMMKFKTRPLDKKRDPWQFGKFPSRRTLDDHVPEYIPKCLRPYPKCKKKFRNTYYPSSPEEDVILKEKKILSRKYFI